MIRKIYFPSLGRGQIPGNPPLIRKSPILAKYAEYNRVIHQSIGKFMLIRNNINTKVYSVIVRTGLNNRL